MNDAQRGIAVANRFGDDPDGDQVVDFVQGDPLSPDLLPDAADALDPRLHGDDRDPGVPQLVRERFPELAHRALGRPAAFVHPCPKRLVSRRIEMAESELFQLVLDKFLELPEKIN